MKIKLKIMKIIMNILRYLLAIFMIYGGVQHFVKPDFYAPFVPSFLPKILYFEFGCAGSAVGANACAKRQIFSIWSIGRFFIDVGISANSYKRCFGGKSSYWNA